MKLRNSIGALDAALTDLTTTRSPMFIPWYNKQMQHIRNTPAIKDGNFALRWSLWFRIDQKVRDDIMRASSVRFVGGYAVDVNDNHISTLLHKVITTDKLNEIHSLVQKQNSSW